MPDELENLRRRNEADLIELVIYQKELIDEQRKYIDILESRLRQIRPFRIDNWN